MFTTETRLPVYIPYLDNSQFLRCTYWNVTVYDVYFKRELGQVLHTACVVDLSFLSVPLCIR